MPKFDVVIVGSGHGGAQAAISLRQRKFGGTIAILTQEEDPPYERPPLSKEYLSGDKTFEQILMRPKAFWEERGIDVFHTCDVRSLDPERRSLSTATDQRFGYGSLIWSAGGEPRRLPCNGADLLGVHSIRSRTDVARLRQELQDTRDVVIIGGGYIGLEAAASLRKLDKNVVLIEALERVLARVAGEPLSRFYEDQHRSHGVDLRLNTVVASIEGANGRVSGVRLQDGSLIPAQIVIVGIGIVPAVQPLRAAGVRCDIGVCVDECCRTSLPDVYGIGDCASHRNPFAQGAQIRLESVQNATDQAIVASKTIMGDAQTYHSVPWFWSNQYDLRLQTVGLSSCHDQTVIRGDVSAGSFSVIYLQKGRVIALDCVNSTRDFVQGKRMVQEQVSPNAELLADANHPMKELGHLDRASHVLQS